MRKEYDFSKGVRGKFYRPHDNCKIVINYGKLRFPPIFEVYIDSDNFFRFRLKDENEKVIFVSDEYKKKTDCFKEIELLKEKSSIVPIIESTV